MSANIPSACSLGGGALHGPTAHITVEVMVNGQKAMFGPSPFRGCTFS